MIRWIQHKLKKRIKQHNKAFRNKEEIYKLKIFIIIYFILKFIFKKRRRKKSLVRRTKIPSHFLGLVHKFVI
jgi:lysozyme family protein